MKQSLCWFGDRTQSFIHSLKKCSLPDLHSPITRYTVSMCVCVYTFIDVNVCVYVRTPLANYIFFPGSLDCLFSKRATQGSLIESPVFHLS